MHRPDRRPLITPLRASFALHALVVGLLVHLAPTPEPAPRRERLHFTMVGEAERLPEEPPPEEASASPGEPVDTLALSDFDVLLPALPIEEDALPTEQDPEAAPASPPLALWPIPRGATRRPAPVGAPPVRVTPTAPPAAEARAVPRVVRRPGTLRGFYPRDAQAAGIEGTALVLVRVDVRGQVVDVRVHASSGDASLDQAALRVARLYEFAPGAPGRALLPVPFRLRD